MTRNTNRETPVATGAAGFTLIELMIVVAVIAIISAVAYPSYQDYVRNSRRADGKAMLNEVAARLEQHYTSNKTYTTVVANLGYTGTAPDTVLSQDQYYSVKIAVGDATSYRLEATARDKGKQNKDTSCSPLKYYSTGLKEPTSGCW